MDYEELGEPFNILHNSLDIQVSTLEKILTNKKYILKLFPQHLNTTIPNLYKSLVMNAEKIYVLIRKNYNDQLQSLYVAERTNYFYSHDRPLRRIGFNHIIFEETNQFLQYNYYHLSQWYKSLPNAELVCLEDLPADGKYNQPVQWDIQPPHIDFDVEHLFKNT